MSESPLLSTNPESITALFERDPAPGGPVSDADIQRMIVELRRRADINASEKAAAEAAPKTAKGGRRRASNPLVDAAIAAIADKPISELSLGDLLDDGEDAQ